MAPDGALFVSDWYDPVGRLNRQADSERGRIYRIAPAGHRQQNKPLNLESGADAITALKSPNLDARYLGWQALHDMGMEAIPHLDPLYAVGNRTNVPAHFGCSVASAVPASHSSTGRWMIPMNQSVWSPFVPLDSLIAGNSST